MLLSHVETSITEHVPIHPLLCQQQKYPISSRSNALLIWWTCFDPQILESALYSGGNQKTFQPNSRISLWKVTSSKAKVSHIISSPFASPYPCCCLRHKEKENNQPEAEVEPPIQVACLEVWLLTLSVTSFGKSPSSVTWRTPTIGFVSHLTKPETTSKLQVKLIHYLVHLHRLKIPPLDGGKVLPEKMPYLCMRQIRQVKMIPHFGT